LEEIGRIAGESFARESVSLEYTQLPTESKDLEAEVVVGTKECAEAGEEVDAKWNHEFGFIA
jgi:hypothetical protein